MSESEDVLSNEVEDENGADGDDSRKLTLVRHILKAAFYSKACSSGIKRCCRSDSDTSSNAAKIRVYNHYQEGIGNLLLNTVLEHPLFDETTMTILEEQARMEVEEEFKALEDKAEAAAEHAELPTEQRLASVSSDGDASTMSGTSTEGTATASSSRREREPNENDDSHNPRHQQRRRLNNHDASASTSIVGPPPGASTTIRSRGEAVVYNEEEVKLQVHNVTEKIKSAFESLNHGRAAPIGVAFDSPLLQMVACTLVEKIRSGESLMKNISSVLQNLLCVGEGTYECRERLISNLRGEAVAVEALPTYGGTISICSLLALLSKNNSISETRVIESVAQNTEVSGSVRHIDSIEKNMATELLRAYSINDQAYKNLLQILSNAWTGGKLYSLLLMSQIFKYLRDEFALTAKAKELHTLKCNSELDGSMTVLDFVETVLLPLSNIQEHALEAVKLLLVIKDVTTNLGSSRVKRDLQPARKEILDDVVSLVQSMDINGTVVSGGDDYLLGNATRLREAVNTLFNLLMEKVIERKLPAQFLASRGGFALGILRLSSSDVIRKCNKFTSEFLFGTSREDGQTADALRQTYGADDDKLIGLNETILKKKLNKNDTSFRGEKKIVIFTAAQMKSFEALGYFALAY